MSSFTANPSLGNDSSLPKPKQNSSKSPGIKVSLVKEPLSRYIEDKQDAHFNLTDISSHARLFIKNCSNCTFSVKCVVMKILLENCHNVIVDAEEKINTNVIEIWKSSDIKFNVSHQVFTAQIDMCEAVQLNFEGPKSYQQVVWTNTQDLEVTFKETPEHNIVTGLKQMKEEYNYLVISDSVDQFFLRIIDGKMINEIMVRLPGGMPTTKREADEWDKVHGPPIYIL